MTYNKRVDMLNRQRRPAMHSPQLEMRSTVGGGGQPIEPHVGPAKVIAFPIVRRVAFIDRTAEVAASYRDPSKYLASVYRQQEDAMRRRGLLGETVQSEIAALRRAIESRIAQYEVRA
jgi:hypothetical protein